LFSQSYSDVIGEGSCGEGEGRECVSGRHVPSGWRPSRSVSAGSEGAGGLDSRLAGGGLDSSSAEAAARFAKHFSFLSRLWSMQTSHSPHHLGRPRNIRREAALPPAQRRRLPLKECSWPRRLLAQRWGRNPVDRPKYRATVAHHFGTLAGFLPVPFENVISPDFAPSLPLTHVRRDPEPSGGTPTSL
jgi:hypothetical protein